MVDFPFRQVWVSPRLALTPTLVSKHSRPLSRGRGYYLGLGRPDGYLWRDSFRCLGETMLITLIVLGNTSSEIFGVATLNMPQALQ